MEEIARDAGLGVLTFEEKSRIWGNAVRTVKARIKQYDIQFPETPELEELFEKAKREQWNASDINWNSLDPRDYDEIQKIAISYWFSVLATFERATPVFAKALIKAYETHAEQPVKFLFVSLVFDEGRHEECCMRCVNRLCPFWPWKWKPRNDLEEKSRIWGNAVRTVKARIKQYDIQFPDMPEIGIYGEQTVEKHLKYSNLTYFQLNGM
jgi:hypothetical protein